MAKEDKPTDVAPQGGGTAPEDSQPTIDDTYKDKTLEEVVKMHQELKSHSDQQLETIKAEKDKEIAAREKDLQAYKSWYEQQGQAAQNAQTTPAAQPVDKTKIVDALLEDPVTTLNQILDYRDRGKAYQSAWSEGPSILAEAKRRNPGAFEGIDEEHLKSVMYNGLQAGSVQPHDFKKPDAWTMGAWQLKGVGTNFSTTPPPPNPPQPHTGDLPPGVKPQVTDEDKDDIAFDPLGNELREAFGRDGKPISKEKAAEMIRKQRENPDPRMSMTETE